MTTKRHAAIFVLSDVRSGSTLLDQCLGGHPDIVSLGEVHWLPAYVREDRDLYDPVHELVCSCGNPLRSCPFWTRVASELGRPLDSLRQRPRFMPASRSREPGALAWRLVRRLVENVPGCYRSGLMRALCGGGRIARDAIALYDAVAAASGRHFCVDSSKSPYRFRAVYELDPGRSVAIVLARDYRAVVDSKMKRGQSLEAAAIGWRQRMRQIATLTADLPRDQVLQLSYESLCRDPERELGAICRFLGVQSDSNMLQRPSGDVHHIGGSPSKFDNSRKAIALDLRYLSRIDRASRERMRRIVGEEAQRWGYGEEPV
jgi:hypothetical protein